MSEKGSQNEYIILQVNNTPAVDLAGTAVASAIKKHFPDRKIIVTTNFPEIWLHNPLIYRVYRFGQTPYFHEDYIRGRETKIFAFDPTKSDAYVNNEKHLVEAWCDLCGVPFAGEKPSLHFTQRESEVAWRMTRTNRPLFFFQPYEMFGNVARSGWSWPKDIPISVAHKISHEMSMAGYAPIMIKNQNQMAVHEAGILQMSLRQTLAALQYMEKGLFVDSFMQVAAAALGKPAVVTWLATNPKNNGYDLHKNMLCRINTDLKVKLDSYHPLFDVDQKQLNEFVDTGAAYNEREIINALLKK